MGLDIYFYKAKKGTYQGYLNEKKEHFGKYNPNITNSEYDALTEAEKAKYVELFDTAPSLTDRIEEVGYFRKVNFIVSFFEYDDNCSYMPVVKAKFDELLDACNDVLDNNGDAESTLPTLGGFFFGSIDYDEWYFKNVSRVRDWCAGLIANTDWENEEILLWCWW